MCFLYLVTLKTYLFLLLPLSDNQYAILYEYIQTIFNLILSIEHSMNKSL